MARVRRVVLLTSPEIGQRLVSIVSEDAPGVEAVYVDNLERLERILAPRDRLIAFGTGLVVPTPLLERSRLEPLNFHAASPDYPGRDPHHWAVYDGVCRYGATLHVMTKNVDAGPIVGVRWFDVSSGICPVELLRAANQEAERLFRQALPAMVADLPLVPVGIQWSGRKHSRADFRAMCRLSPSLGEEEIRRRLFAFDAEGYRNFTLHVGDQAFLLEPLAVGSP